jgi:hypothetical protein
LEFVNKREVADLLHEGGYEEVAEGTERVYLKMADHEGVVHLHFSDTACATPPRNGATVIPTRADDLPSLLDQIIHRLNLHELLIFPVGRWRHVFDAVAFSLAANEAWQEVDASATVELNTRDPLVCGPADFPLVVDLIRALFKDAEGPNQGLLLSGTGVPILAEVVPTGALRVSLGNQALADEVMEVLV